MVEQAEIRVVRCGGSKINYREAIITFDSKFLLCASGDSVKVYSTSTEECVHILEGHTDLVSGLAFNPANHLQVYSCSLDGTIRLWDYTDGILIKTLVIGYKILALYVEKKHEGVLFVIVPMASDTDSETFQLVAVHLPKSAGQEVEVRELSSVLTEVRPSPGATSFGRGGEYIATANGLQLSVYFFKKQRTYRFFLKASDKKGAKNAFTCVSCHPKEDCIATGHQDGKIRLWRNFNQKKEYTYTTQHWHHNAVSALSFTPEGMNLLSGGIESVLVLWRYGAESKDLLPRLGSAIEHISVSPDGSLFCTSHRDNKITVINSNLKVSAVIQGLVKGEDVRTDLIIDPRTKSLVLNGKPGHLQFYSLHHDKQLYNLDIVQQEYIHQSGLEQFDVVKAAFHSRGTWLATIEERRERTAELETGLKLWAYDEQTQSFVLNTSVSSPHEDRITAMCFSTDEEATLLVTAGKDGHFKAWQLAEDWETHRDGISWSCDFVGSYHHLRPTNCCFSADGSLLAVSFQEIVTVWSPDSWELLLTLCQPPGGHQGLAGNPVRDLCFGRLSCSKYLLGTTSNTLLCCWDILTCSLKWSTSMDVTLLQADPLSENMAAFCSTLGTTDLFVFKPSEPRPLYSQKAVCPGKVHRAVFAPREAALESCEERAQWLNRSQLYFMTEHMDLMTFNTKSEEDKMMASSQQLVIDDSVAMTPFYLLLGKHRQLQQEKPNPQATQMTQRVQLPQGSSAIRELLHTPAHVLPSASVLCTMFVNSLLISNTGVREGSEAKEEEMVSEPEEDANSEEETNPRDCQPARVNESCTEEAVPTISRAQERQLRTARKTDYSWLSRSLFSSP
ncbi:hypothetical protein SKAU_G00230030 [Synaphobranchus kaupii]|uniref:WD repeat-containing protein 75 second beta-propeller domain-containing protein n=1 Tax=Synaphobranchus kaupii TaxID=118154 RepID=A0A9Q1F5E1_SYNKA|nr:hypothetical protein SKAU_G00230030 [Synaphobranchus kaupii]